MIEIKSLTKIYQNDKNNKVYGLNQVTLEMPDKGLIIIYGESGSGKTTLLNCLAGYDYYDEGIIKFYNAKTTSSVFQDFQLIDHLTVLENLKVACDINLIEDINKIYDVLDKLNLSEVMNQYPNQLSGGQKQRVAIARSILLDSDIILVDEPTGNIDEENKKIIKELFVSLAKEKLVIMVTHDPNYFMEESDMSIVLSKGKIQSIIKKDHVVHQKQLKEESKIATFKLPFSIASKMVFKGFRHLRKKYVLTSVLTLMTMILSLFFLNIVFQDKEKSAYYGFQENNYQAIDFVNSTTVSENSYSTYNDTSYEQLQNLLDLDYRAVKFFKTDSPLTMEVIDPNNIFSLEKDIYKIAIDDEIPTNLVWSTDIDYSNEIYVSKVIADIIIQDAHLEGYSDLSEYGYILRGIEVYIKGVYDTGIMDINEEIDTNYHYAITTNTETYKAISNAYDKITVDIAVDDEDTRAYIVSTNLDDENILFGTNIVQSNQIIISDLFAEEVLGVTENQQQLIGQDVQLKFMDRGSYLDEQTYVVAAIFENQGITSPNIYVDENGINDFEYKYSYYSLENKGYHGLSIYNYDLDLFYDIESINLSHDMPNSLFMNQISTFLDSTRGIVLSISTLLMLVTLLVYVNFIDNSILNKQREIGVLRSIGVNSREIIKMFAIENIMILFPSLIVSIIVVRVLIDTFNEYVINQNLVTSDVFYQSFEANLFILIYTFLMAIIYMLISTYKIYKKSTIELIYYKK